LWFGLVIAGVFLAVIVLTGFATTFAQRTIFVDDDVQRGERFAETLRPNWAADSEGVAWKQGITADCRIAATAFYSHPLGTESGAPRDQAAFFMGCAGRPVG
jgi:hypothetical protein